MFIMMTILLAAHKLRARGLRVPGGGNNNRERKHLHRGSVAHSGISAHWVTHKISFSPPFNWLISYGVIVWTVFKSPWMFLCMSSEYKKQLASVKNVSCKCMYSIYVYVYVNAIRRRLKNVGWERYRYPWWHHTGPVSRTLCFGSFCKA